MTCRYGLSPQTPRNLFILVSYHECTITPYRSSPSSMASSSRSFVTPTVLGLCCVVLAVFMIAGGTWNPLKVLPRIFFFGLSMGPLTFILMVGGLLWMGNYLIKRGDG